jgi:NAD(P)-dependent dehydrogenase (short-subunit alcohol dehydrogenase family)
MFLQYADYLLFRKPAALHYPSPSNVERTLTQIRGLFRGARHRSAEQAQNELAVFNPQGRLIEPEEVASSVAWLCRPESSAITGQDIPVAGGEIM